MEGFSMISEEGAREQQKEEEDEDATSFKRRRKSLAVDKLSLIFEMQASREGTHYQIHVMIC